MNNYSSTQYVKVWRVDVESFAIMSLLETSSTRVNVNNEFIPNNLNIQTTYDTVIGVYKERNNIDNNILT